MKLTDLFLTEETLISKKWDIAPVEVDKIVEVLNTHCKKSLIDIGNNKILWRGMSDIGPSAILDSTDSFRTSRDTSNIYQLMMDVSENMKNVPSRSRSFICTTKKSSAELYSLDVYALIPFDEVPIAIASSNDILKTKLKNIGINLNIFSFDFRNVLNALRIYPDDQRFSKFLNPEKLNVELSAISPEMVFFAVAVSAQFEKDSVIQKFIQAYNENVEDSYKVKTPRDLIRHYKYGFFDHDEFEKNIGLLMKKDIAKKYFDLVVKQPNKRFTNLANLLMTPENLGISVVTPGNIKTQHYAECWFSGKCVAVKDELFQEILKKIKK